MKDYDGLVERVSKFMFSEETFALYKKAKSIANKAVEYDLPTYYTRQTDSAYIIEGISSPKRDIEIIECDREDAVVDEGIGAFSSFPMLILNVPFVPTRVLDETSVRGLFIGEKVKTIQLDSLAQQCRFLYVVSSNPNYCSDNNVIYTKNKSRIVAYAGYKPEETFEVDDCVKSIGRYAFWFTPYLKKLIIGKNIDLSGVLIDKYVEVIRK
ncbi:MAG: hypothetical protein ACI4MN_00035 [Candidatus Coproplasma sp.]